MEYLYITKQDELNLALSFFFLFPFSFYFLTFVRIEFFFRILYNVLKIAFFLLLALNSNGVNETEILFDRMTLLLDINSFTSAVNALIVLITPSCFALHSSHLYAQDKQGGAKLIILIP